MPLNLFLHYRTDGCLDGSVPSIYWQAAEGPMTLLCVCLPSMLALWRRLVSLWRPQNPTNASGGNSYFSGTGRSANSNSKAGPDSITCNTEMNTFTANESQDNRSLYGSESRILCHPTTIYRPIHDETDHSQHHEARSNNDSRGIYVQKDIDVTRTRQGT
jgi:hypothetical protein